MLTEPAAAIERSIARNREQETQNGSAEFTVCMCVYGKISTITSTRYLHRETMLLTDHGPVVAH